MNIWHDIACDRIKPDDFWCVIEIPKGSKNKYELDKETGLLKVDRILFTSTHYPANYGFIPRTYAEDDDPIDVLVLCSEPLCSLALVHCYPIGQIRMLDEGSEDIKIIAVPFKDPMYNSYKSVTELPPHVSMEVRHFFNVYKQLEEKQMIVEDMEDRDVAVRAIAAAIDKYKEKFGDRDPCDECDNRK